MKIVIQPGAVAIMDDLSIDELVLWIHWASLWKCRSITAGKSDAATEKSLVLWSERPIFPKYRKSLGRILGLLDERWRNVDDSTPADAADVSQKFRRALGDVRVHAELELDDEIVRLFRTIDDRRSSERSGGSRARAPFILWSPVDLALQWWNLGAILAAWRRGVTRAKPAEPSPLSRKATELLERLSQVSEETRQRTRQVRFALFRRDPREDSFYQTLNDLHGDMAEFLQNWAGELDDAPESESQIRLADVDRRLDQAWTEALQAGWPPVVLAEFFPGLTPWQASDGSSDAPGDLIASLERAGLSPPWLSAYAAIGGLFARSDCIADIQRAENVLQHIAVGIQHRLNDRDAQFEFWDDRPASSVASFVADTLTPPPTSRGLRLIIDGRPAWNLRRESRRRTQIRLLAGELQQADPSFPQCNHDSHLDAVAEVPPDKGALADLLAWIKKLHDLGRLSASARSATVDSTKYRELAALVFGYLSEELGINVTPRLDAAGQFAFRAGELPPKNITCRWKKSDQPQATLLATTAFTVVGGEKAEWELSAGPGGLPERFRVWYQLSDPPRYNLTDTQPRELKEIRRDLLLLPFLSGDSSVANSLARIRDDLKKWFATYPEAADWLHRLCSAAWQKDPDASKWRDALRDHLGLELYPAVMSGTKSELPAESVLAAAHVAFEFDDNCPLRCVLRVDRFSSTSHEARYAISLGSRKSAPSSVVAAFNLAQRRLGDTFAAELFRGTVERYLYDRPLDRDKYLRAIPDFLDKVVAEKIGRSLEQGACHSDLNENDAKQQDELATLLDRWAEGELGCRLSPRDYSWSRPISYDPARTDEASEIAYGFGDQPSKTLLVRGFGCGPTPCRLTVSAGAEPPCYDELLRSLESLAHDKARAATENLRAWPEKLAAADELSRAELISLFRNVYDLMQDLRDDDSKDAIKQQLRKLLQHYDCESREPVEFAPAEIGRTVEIKGDCQDGKRLGKILRPALYRNDVCISMAWITLLP